MRILLGTIVAVLLCLPSLSRAAVAEVSLLGETLAAQVDLGLGGPRQVPTGAFEDAGSGSDAGAYLLEGCASIATQFTSALILGLALGVGVLSAGSNDAAIGMVVVGALVGSLLIPLVTSGVVYGIAKAFGNQPSYGRIVLASYAARLTFALVGLMLPASGATAASIIGMFVGAAAEVYAANTSSVGVGGDVAPTVVRAPEARPLARRVSEASSEKRAPGLSLAFAF